MGRNTDQIVPSWDSIIWNEHLEPLSQIELAEIQAPCRRHPDGWYTDFAEAARISKIRNARRKLRERIQPRELGDAFKSVSLRRSACAGSGNSRA